MDAHADFVAAEERQDWERWTHQQLSSADRVLVIVSPEYKRRFEGTAAPGTGRGVRYEARFNQPRLLAALDALSWTTIEIGHTEQHKGHVRRDRRVLKVIDLTNPAHQHHRVHFPGARQAFLIERYRHFPDGTVTAAAILGITSLTPEQASPADHETMYQCSYPRVRGELRTRLTLAVRQGRTRRVARSRTAAARGEMPDMVDIGGRPVEAEDRAVPGSREGDLIVGEGGKSQIATLVERSSRCVMLIRIPYDRTAERVAALSAGRMETLPDLLRNSVTWGQGEEMAAHAGFTVKTGIDVYFCDPRSPWRRGSDENANGLPRRCSPEGTDLSVYSQAELDAVADELDDRQRQTLGRLKPTEVFNEFLVEACGAPTA